MPDPRNFRPSPIEGNPDFLNSLVGQMHNQMHRSAKTSTESEILEALKRIEAKLNEPQSLIITGSEVDRIIKSLKEQP